MPSPTSSTRPTSRTSWPAPISLISRRRTETISSGLNFIAAPRQQLISDSVDPRTDRAVEHLIADLDDHPAQEFRIDPHPDDRLQPGRLGDFLFPHLRVALVQRYCRSHPDPQPLVPLVEQVAIRCPHVPQQGQPVLGIQYAEEVEQEVADFLVESLVDELFLGGAPYDRRGEGAYHLRGLHQHF